MFEVEEDKTCPVIGTEAFQSLLKLVDGVVRQSVFDANTLRERFDVRWLPLLRSEERSAAIDRDRQQPRTKWSFSIPAVEASERAQEGLLGDVFRIVRIADDTHADSENDVLIPLYKATCGHLVAGKDSCDQLLVAGDNSSINVGVRENRNPLQGLPLGIDLRFRRLVSER